MDPLTNCLCCQIKQVTQNHTWILWNKSKRIHGAAKKPMVDFFGSRPAFQTNQLVCGFAATVKLFKVQPPDFFVADLYP